MALNNELLIKINGSAKNFTDELDKAKKKTADLERSLASAAKVSAAAFVVLAGAVGLAVNQFSKFEKEFTNVVTLLDKTSFTTKSLKQGIDDLKNGVLQLGATSGENFETLNKGLFDIISATGDAENAMGVLAAATNLAIAGGTDVSVAVNGITGAIKAFGLETSDAQLVAEKFFQAQKGGKTTVEELSNSIGVAAATAKAYNVSLDELLAASTAATLASIKTNTTFTGLKAAFANISKPTEDAAKEAKRLGVEFNSTALRAQGLEGFLKSLTEAEGFTQQSVEKLFGSVEAQNIIFALTGEQAGAFASQIKLLGDEQNAAATFADALAVKQATTERAFARLARSVEAIGITFGEIFAPAINAAADALNSIAVEISKVDKRTLKVIAAITAVGLALTGLTTVLLLAGLAYIKVDRAIKILNTTFGLSTKAIALQNFVMANSRQAIAIFRRGMLIATTSVRGFAAATGIGLVLVAISLLITNFREVKAVVAGTFAAAKVIIENVMSAIAGAFNDFVNSTAITHLGKILEPFINSVGRALAFARDVFSAIGSTISDFVSRGAELFGDFGKLVGSIFTFDLSAIKSAIAGLGSALAGGFGDVGKGAGTAFVDAYNKSIAESDAAELPDIEAPKVGGQKIEDPAAPGKTKDNSIDQEKEAAKRLREIRARENELLLEQDRRSALDRIEVKDAELKKISDEEKKAADDSLKINREQLEALKTIDKLKSENAELEAKKTRTAVEQVQLEANEKELVTVQGQFENLRAIQSQNNELEAIEQQERDLAKIERIEEQGEQEAALKAELDELAVEERAVLDEAEILKAQETILTKRQAEKLAAQEQLKENIERRNKFVKDEEKHGTTVAKLNQFFSSANVSLAKDTADSLVALTQSKNSTLKAIGKAAALTQIGIDTATGALSTFAKINGQLGFPAGPIIGGIAAAAIVAFGAEKAAAVASAQRGGIVPNGIGGSNDRIPAFLQPGELVVPAPLAPDFIQAVGRPEVDNEGRGGETRVVIDFTERAIPYIEQRLLERRAIGTGNL